MTTMLGGRFVRLRPVQRRDLERIRSFRADPFLRAAILAEGPPETSEQHEAWFEGLGRSAEQRIFAIAAVATDEVVGACGLYQLRPDHGHAEWGFYLGDVSTRMSGAGVEAELALLDFAFEEEGLSRLWCRVLASQDRVVSMHRRFGFQVEGTLRRHFRGPAGFEDVVLMGILRDEYTATRPAVASLLDRLAASHGAEGDAR